MSVPRRAEQGYTLAELSFVLVLIGLLATPLVLRFPIALEQTRVDRAAGILRSIWVGQRLHYVEQQTFAGDLQDLADLKLVEGWILDQSSPFAFSVTASTVKTFTAQALRQGSTDWGGSISIDEFGRLVGSTQNGEGQLVEPATNE